MKKTDIQRSFERAIQYLQNKDFSEAERLLLELIESSKEFPEAFHLLGIIALNRSETEKACVFFEKAAETGPYEPKYLYNYGVVLQDLGKMSEAIAAYERVLAVEPDHEGAHNNLGAAYRSLGQLIKSEKHLKKALAIRPENINALANLGTTLRDQGNVEEALESYQIALKCDPQNHQVHSNMLLCMHYLEGHERDKLLADHISWSEIHCSNLMRFEHPALKISPKDRIIRLGYVSGDFCTHSVAYFLKALILNHDRNRFEVFCYNTGDKKDKTTEWFMDLPVTWRDIASIGDEDAAIVIFGDKIDVLIDCSGHTSNSRLRVFAHKPAPVQVTYIGYPNTTGLKEIDYRIVDEWTDPQSITWKGTERPVRLSEGFLCYTPPEKAPEVTSLPAINKGFITFGSFNNLPKLNNRVMELWGRLLVELQEAELVLKTKQFNDKAVVDRYRGYFKDMGIAGERIKTIGYSPSNQEHLKWYGKIDVALDPFPYNGTTTTYEALYMGVPIITLEGDRHSGRVGKSIMYQMGLTQFVAQSFDRYLKLGKYLAENPEILVSLRDSLRSRVVEKNNGREFTRELEELFEWMLEKNYSSQVKQ